MQAVPLILAASLCAGGALGGFLLGRRHRLSPAQRRLVLHLCSGQPRLLLVGCPPPAPDRWVPAASCCRYTLTLADGQVLSLQELTSFLVADSRGRLLDSESPCAPLPPWISAAAPQPPAAPPAPQSPAPR